MERLINDIDGVDLAVYLSYPRYMLHALCMQMVSRQTLQMHDVGVQLHHAGVAHLTQRPR